MDDFKKEESKGSMWKKMMRRIARHRLKQKDNKTGIIKN